MLGRLVGIPLASEGMVALAGRARRSQDAIRRRAVPVVLVGLIAFFFLGAAAGMWKAKYWAVLGFQALLGITLVLCSLSLIRASNLLGFLIPTVIIVFGGWLFWKLIRAMARIQMPERPGS